ncbi:uncharacterized protein A4U43_C05F6110 [Asparagus officinalis]|uniref:Uncharacterized protein n=1 Tax=Asparagus officinalis TaxID=4686 RepID=A0A5P1EPZ1_ASPOF|nr:uncharacterized protein A4U43_C05F6110 [Asparagus officinalis]
MAGRGLFAARLRLPERVASEEATAADGLGAGQRYGAVAVRFWPRRRHRRRLGLAVVGERAQICARPPRGGAATEPPLGGSVLAEPPRGGSPFSGFAVYPSFIVAMDSDLAVRILIWQ